MPAPTESIITAYWHTINARDWDAFAALLHEDVLYAIPQTRERVRGRANYVAFNATFPGAWVITVESVIADEQRGVSRIVSTLDGEDSTAITFFELRGSQIASVVDYWPESYEPPPRAISVIERY